ncbi:hypothetical protein VTP01DRAFT_4168 [Rhizomucor pusillus]|uniref:uncharacterized protein n=1 Tax=Rhizomucor pusillus TaxID=4840 RepID=UPI003744A3CA
MDPEVDTKRKRQRKDGQPARHAANVNSNAGSICASCGRSGHSNSASRNCINQKPNIKERIIQKFGKDHERFTRCVPFKNVVRPAYCQIRQEAVVQRSSLLSEILTRTFWYSVSQLILDQAITNTNPSFPEDFKAYWHRFAQNYSKIRHTLNVSGYSDILSAACLEMSTAYTNYITENLQKIVEIYILYRLEIFIPNLLSKQQARRIANEYLYEVVAGGEPALDLLEEAPLEVPWSIKNVSANPGLFIPVLYAILQEFEREHELASKMGTKTTTKLLALTPRPNFQWRFITINENALRALTGICSEHPFEEILGLTKYRFLT